MAWSSSDRSSRLPKNWKTIRARVLKRDGGQCAVTGPQGRCPNIATEVDHISPGDDHSMNNLRAICSPHHRRKSSQEGAHASNAAQAANRREIQRRTARFDRREQHPGEL